MNSILASVNGTPISLQDILPLTRAAEFRVFSSCVGEELQKRILEIRRRAADELIDRKLILEDYAGKSFELSDKDIESALDDMAEKSGLRSRTEFRDALRKQGSDIEEVKKNIRESMIVQLMLHREYLTVKSITPEKMYALYLRNREAAKGNSSVELAMILLDKSNSSRSQYVAEELNKNPSRFAALAAQYSSGPGKEEGGKLGKIRSDLLRPEFARVLKFPEINKVYGPIATPEGTVFLKVLSCTSLQQKSFKESLPEIREQLEKGQRRESRKNYIQRLRKNAIIRYFF
jgi:parvulin-like peptidyl-prolyl isomerase